MFDEPMHYFVLWDSNMSHAHKIFKATRITNIKMAKNKISMPSSTAGITRYFDDYRSKVEFKPGHIIIIICVIIVLELIFLSIGTGFLG